MASADLELCYLSASEALARFKARTLSPVELLDAQITRTQAVNPKLNAITYDYFDRAREQAKKAEAKYGKTDGRLRALEGVPVAIKDFHTVKGEITTLGSKIFENFRPDYTAPTVDRLLRAGAIMHMRSTSPEFAHSGATHSPLWGVTRNPWNLEYTPGGSSAAQARWSPPAWRRLPMGPTAAAPSASRPQPAASSATSRPSAATRWTATIPSRPSCTMARSSAAWPMLR